MGPRDKLKMYTYVEDRYGVEEDRGQLVFNVASSMLAIYNGLRNVKTASGSENKQLVDDAVKYIEEGKMLPRDDVDMEVLRKVAQYIKDECA